MKRILLIIVILLCLFLLVSMIWRLSSHRIKLPCPTWLGWLVELDNPFSKINRAVAIIVHSDLQPGMTVIDIGCGPGRVTIPVAQKVGSGGHVVAMDMQRGMIERVQAKARAANLTNIAFLNEGIGEGKLEYNKFDRALLVTVLGEIPNQKAALKEIFDALKPGGILSITEIILDPHYQRYNSVLQLAQEVGFEKKDLFSDWVAYNLLLEKPLK
jgi:ubiquinone/menaquinone biosynthesis C-methylase UbiE